VLLAPRVDVALRDLRVRYFRNLSRRMPAHVTLLFPFRSPVDPETLATVGEVCARVMAFDATFREPGRFRSDVVWLRPEPDGEFERASDTVLEAFGDCAPYGGAHASRTLHLTVASRLRGGEADRLVDEIGDVLPLTDRIDRLSLMAETGSGWREAHSWPLTLP
jgi:2'-5' RNA ligase